MIDQKDLVAGEDEAPQDFDFLVDREYAKIAELLKPGRRAGAEARARIRTLLAMEAPTEPETKVSDKDVTRVEKGIRQGKARAVVFPRLSNVGAAITGSGLAVHVPFVKKGGLPVTYVGDNDVDAAAVRTVDLQKKYHRSALRHSGQTWADATKGACVAYSSRDRQRPEPDSYLSFRLTAPSEIL